MAWFSDILVVHFGSNHSPITNNKRDMLPVYTKLLLTVILWFFFMAIMYWFGWLSDRYFDDPSHNMTIKMLRLSPEDVKKRKESRKPTAKLIMVLVSLFTVLLIFAVLVQSGALPLAQ